MLRALLLALLQPLRLFLYGWFRLRALHRPFVLQLAVRGEYSEAPLSHGIWTFFKPARDRFYLLCLELQSVITAASARRLRLKHIALTIESHNLGWAQAWELRQLLAKARDQGIRTSCWLIADDRVSLYIATGCEFIYAAEGATFDLSPFTSESLFMLSLLGKLGVRPQFLSVGDFKSAAEIFTRNSMSRAARQQTEELLADLEAEFFRAVAERAPSLKRTGRPQLLSATAAAAAGLVQGTASAQEYAAWIKVPEKMVVRELSQALSLVRARSFRLLPFRRAHRVALVVAEGNIVESHRPRPGSINWHDYETVAGELRSGNFNAALLRINSPGGSALVSQLLWREWMLATHRIEGRKLDSNATQPEEPTRASKKKKRPSPLPVIVSQGNVAASGGYYLSAAGDTVFTTPLTITGSIGVVGGKFNVAPLLAKWGISVDRAPKKNTAPFFSAFADFASVQKQQLAANMQEIYEQFLRDVAQGRGTVHEKIRPLASGRVYSGKRAHSLGLADSEGGLTDALAAIRQKLGLTALSPLEIAILPSVHESLFSRAGLPLGLSRFAALADFAMPGIYALDPRWVSLA
ncbi:MAG: S49 family peptidase [Spirochaetota bacterium]